MSSVCCIESAGGMAFAICKCLGGLPLGIFVLVGSRQRHRVTDLLSEFFRKYRSLTAH